MGLAIGDELRLDAAVQHAVGRLEERHGVDRLEALELRDVEVADAGPADLAFLHQLGDRGPTLLDVLVGLRPVDLVHVDDVDAQPAQAVLDLAADAGALEARDNLAFLVPAAFALGGDDGPATFELLERPAHDVFAVAEPVDRRGVEPVDAEIQRFVDRADREGVVLRTPAEFPVAAAHRPGTEADRGEVEVRAAELAELHGAYLDSPLRALFASCSCFWVRIGHSG